MTDTTQQDRAIRFRDLHRDPPILVLPNAWDVASACLFEEAGFPAVGTTSAGVAASLGYPDGQHLPREELFALVRRITRIVRIPVSVDIEAGYGETPEEVAATVRAVIAAGGVGINLEDSTGESEETLIDISRQVEKIRAVREAASAEGLSLVINARVDLFRWRDGDPNARFLHAVERANAYRSAGADCIFVPFVIDAALITDLAQAIEGPINILATPAAPDVPTLERLGVARVSVGSGPYRATLGLIRRIADELRTKGTYTAFAQDAYPYPDMNRLLDETKG